MKRCGSAQGRIRVFRLFRRIHDPRKCSLGASHSEKKIFWVSWCFPCITVYRYIHRRASINSRKWNSIITGPTSHLYRTIGPRICRSCAGCMPAILSSSVDDLWLRHFTVQVYDESTAVRFNKLARSAAHAYCLGHCGVKNLSLVY